MGTVKINVDAAVGKNTGVLALATIARSDARHYLGGSSVTISGKTNPEMLETLACREGMALARDIDTCIIRLASDCLNAVRSINEGTMGDWAHVVCEIDEAGESF
jgi:ribonuclease HI